MRYGLKPVSKRQDDWLSALDWGEFERLLATHYRSAGYTVAEVGTADGTRRFDGGIDLRLSRYDERVLVQCKHWNACKVTHNAVHQLLGIVAVQRADRGILVNSGEFTAAAHRAANASDRIELIDGRALRKLLADQAPTDRSIPTPAHTALRALPHRAASALWRTHLALIAFRLLIALGAITLIGTVLQHYRDRIMAAPSTPTRPATPSAVTPSRDAQQTITSRADASAKPYAAPTTERERNMRLELVRHAVLEFDGVTSAAWLPSGALMIGMATSTAHSRGLVAERACELLERYPEMGRVLEIQDTRAATARGARPRRVACR